MINNQITLLYPCIWCGQNHPIKFVPILGDKDILAPTCPVQAPDGIVRVSATLDWDG